jgi:inorganic triphosphatase YgiF
LFKQAKHAAPRTLYGVYYDTPELELWRAGVVLRLRREGSRWSQTVTAGGDAGRSPRARKG